MDNNQKLTAFMQRISEHMDAQIAQEESDTAQETVSFLQAEETEGIAQANAEIEAARRAMHFDHRKRLSQTSLHTKTALLLKRKTLQTELFAALYQKLLDFSHSADYADWLVQLIQIHAPEAGDTICLRAEDLPLVSKLQAHCNPTCKFESDPNIHLGGLSINAANGRLCRNHTLDEAYAAQQRDFYRNHPEQGGTVQ